MTCIAVRAGFMAADSQATGNFKTGVLKLHRREKAIVGVAGDYSQAMVFVDWYFDRNQRKPEIANEDGWEALTLTAEGLEYWDASLRPTLVLDDFYAIGSGACLAMGAMEAGASAKRAVEIACKRDPYCAGPVVAMRLRK